MFGHVTTLTAFIAGFGRPGTLFPVDIFDMNVPKIKQIQISLKKKTNFNMYLVVKQFFKSFNRKLRLHVLFASTFVIAVWAIEWFKAFMN